MKINNKLIVALSSISLFSVMGIVIIKLISKYKNGIDQLNHSFQDLNSILGNDIYDVVWEIKYFLKEYVKKEEENKDDTGNC